MTLNDGCSLFQKARHDSITTVESVLKRIRRFATKLIQGSDTRFGTLQQLPKLRIRTLDAESHIRKRWIRRFATKRIQGSDTRFGTWQKLPESRIRTLDAESHIRKRLRNPQSRVLTRGLDDAE